MKSVRYTGTNYEEVKALCGDKVLVPRRAGRPLLDGRVIAAIVFKHPEIFCFNEGRVRLLM